MSVKWMDLSRYGVVFAIGSTNGENGVIKPLITGPSDQLNKMEKTLRTLGFSKQSDTRWFVNWTKVPKSEAWEEHFPMCKSVPLSEILHEVILDKWARAAIIERGVATEQEFNEADKRVQASVESDAAKGEAINKEQTVEDPPGMNRESDIDLPNDSKSTAQTQRDFEGLSQNSDASVSEDEIHSDSESHRPETATTIDGNASSPTNEYLEGFNKAGKEQSVSSDEVSDSQLYTENGITEENQKVRIKPLLEAYGLASAWVYDNGKINLNVYGAREVIALYRDVLKETGFSLVNEQMVAISEEDIRLSTINDKFPMAPVVQDSTVLELSDIELPMRLDLSNNVSWSSFRNAIANKVMNGLDRLDIVELKILLASVSGFDKRLIRSEFGLNDRSITEEVEASLTTLYKKEVSLAQNIEAIVDLGEKLDNVIPNVNAKTANSMALQQYSTPFLISGALQYAMHIETATTIWEPTIGNGSLVALAPEGSTIDGLEIDNDRASRLSKSGYPGVVQGDAITSNIDFPGSYSRVITNPPFGGFPDKQGPRVFSTDVPTEDGGLTPEITLHSQDKYIALRHFEYMSPNGLGGMIIGADNPAQYKPGEMSFKTKAFLNFLSDNYHVLDIQYVDGSLYSSRGAGWPLIMAVTAGKRETLAESELPETLPVIKSKEDLIAFANKNRDLTRTFLDPNNTAELNSQKEHVYQNVNVPDNEDNNPDNQQEEVESRDPDVEEVNHVQTDEATGVVDTSNEDEWLNHRDEEKYENSQRHADVNEKTAVYKARSSAKSLNKRIPSNLVAPVSEALDRVELANGNIDVWVADQMGWTIEELESNLAAEQIDAVALAMYQAEQGKGFILGDNTGVGKGRTVATLLAWSIKNGMKPIFCTSKAGLFHDMMRDLEDIGESELVEPFVLNDGVSVTDPKTKKELIKATPKATVQKALQESVIPEGYNCVFMTYSQVNRERARSKKAQWLSIVAEDNTLLFDEVHNASGDNSNTGDNIRSAIRSARFSLGASATYAKRPDNLGLYEFTSMFAGSDSESLVQAVAEGGAEYQEVLSTMLAASGQLIVRAHRPAPAPEASIVNPVYSEGFNGREFVDRLARVLDAMTSLADEGESIVNSENALIKEMIEEMPDGSKGNYKHWQAQSFSFGSQAHNIVKVAMYAAKADAIVDLVEDEIKEGRRVTVALEGTMETFLRAAHAKEVAKALSEGEENREQGIPASPMGVVSLNLSYRDTLINYLDRIVMIKRVDRYGKESIEPFVSCLEALKEAYAEGELTKVLGGLLKEKVITQEEAARAKLYFSVVETIYALPASLPASPLDYVQYQLAQRGIKSAEMTGRDLGLNYDTETGMPEFRHRTEKEKNRVKVANDFNNGDIQAVFFNAAASEGVSLNPSLRFVNQEPRTMLFWQVIGDINQFNQQAGRIDRSGQSDDVMPRYKIVAFDCPTEKRTMGNLEKKDGSLKANTRADRDTGLQIYGVPMMNRVGDLVTLEVLIKHPNSEEICQKLGIDLKAELNLFSESGKREGTGSETGLHNKLSGRLSRMVLAESEPLLAEIEEAYLERIQWLDQQGTNPLKTKIHDFQGTTVKTHEIFPRSGPSEFESSVNAIEIDFIDYIEPIPFHKVEKTMVASKELLKNRGFLTDMPLEEAWVSIEDSLQQKLKQTAAKHLRDFIRSLEARKLDPIQGLLDALAKSPNSVCEDRDLLERLQAIRQDLVQFARLKKLIGLGSDVSNFPVSQAVYDCDTEYADLVVTRIIPPSSGGYDQRPNYASAGSWKIRMTSPDPAVGQFDISLRQLMRFSNAEPKMKISNELLHITDIQERFHDGRQPQTIPSKRFVLVGQLFRAYEIMENSKLGKGQAGVFTADGMLRRGIIMPRDSDMSVVSKLLDSDFTMSQPDLAKAYLKRVRDTNQNPVMYSIQAHKNLEWASSNPKKPKAFTCGTGVVLKRDNDTYSWKLLISAKKKNSKAFMEDQKLKEMLTADFATDSNNKFLMGAVISDDEVDNVVEYLMREHGQSFHGHSEHADWYRDTVRERGQRLIELQKERDNASKSFGTGNTFDAIVAKNENKMTARVPSEMVDIQLEHKPLDLEF